MNGATTSSPVAVTVTNAPTVGLTSPTNNSSDSAPASVTLTASASDPAAERLLKEAIAKLSLSARVCHRVLRVARTIADLAGSESIGAAQLAEAIQYRRLDATF